LLASSFPHPLLPLSLFCIYIFIKCSMLPEGNHFLTLPCELLSKELIQIFVMPRACLLKSIPLFLDALAGSCNALSRFHSEKNAS
jgi:hypothetical protein